LAADLVKARFLYVREFVMTEHTMHPYEVKCALRLNGHHYQRQHPGFSLTPVLETYWETDNWHHLSTEEAMAAMFLLHKALQIWEKIRRPKDRWIAITEPFTASTTC
jgi:hypothetical protein